MHSSQEKFVATVDKSLADAYVWKGDDEAWREVFFDELHLESMVSDQEPGSHKTE